MSVLRATRWNSLVLWSLAALTIGVIGRSLTEIGPWYLNLREPAWKPPDTAFGPIWTTIFVLTALAGFRAYNAEPARQGRQRMIRFFAVNAVLGVLWSLLFFTFRRPDLALLEVGPFWLSILVLTIVLFRRSALAGALLLPYLTWVGIASVLNYQVVLLNGPFR